MDGIKEDFRRCRVIATGHAGFVLGEIGVWFISSIFANALLIHMIGGVITRVGFLVKWGVSPIKVISTSVLERILITVVLTAMAIISQALVVSMITTLVSLAGPFIVLVGMAVQRRCQR